MCFSNGTGSVQDFSLPLPETAAHPLYRVARLSHPTEAGLSCNTSTGRAARAQEALLTLTAIQLDKTRNRFKLRSVFEGSIFDSLFFWFVGLFSKGIVFLEGKFLFAK